MALYALAWMIAGISFVNLFSIRHADEYQSPFLICGVFFCGVVAFAGGREEFLDALISSALFYIAGAQLISLLFHIIKAWHLKQPPTEHLFSSDTEKYQP